MTPRYGSSNGRLDIWWDNRSDFNAHNEKSVFAGAMYDLKGWNLPGWAVGASYVYGWDAKPSNVSSGDKYYDAEIPLKSRPTALTCFIRCRKGWQRHLIQAAFHPI
jgi:hypothetical protein